MKIPPAPERYGDRLFGSERAHEYARLDGSGDVTRWLADRVPLAEVVALDRDPAYLSALTAPNLSIAESDITVPATDHGSFDLIHARFLLVHLRERDAVLERLVSWLRPGGVLILSDSTDLATASSGHNGYRKTLSVLYLAIAETIGSDVEFGRQYPALLQRRGLVDIGLAADRPVVHAGSPFADFWHLTIDQVRPHILATGLADETDVSAALEYLQAPTTHGLRSEC